MPALQKSRIESLAIIAGGGDLPERLAQACEQQDIDIFIVGFEGQTAPDVMGGRNHMLTRLGAAGQIITTLKSHDIHDLVLIGSIKRPSLSELKPDMRTARFFSRLGLRALGDDGLLKALRTELEGEGFAIHGVQEFVADLLTPEGSLGRYKPKKADMPDIEQGIRISQALGRMDVGQSVIVQEGIILGVEAAEGTNELIRRCARLKRQGRGGILVKTCKPGQDKDLDLPTIGPETIKTCAEAGLTGIVVHAGHSLLSEPDEVVALADKHKMFVFSTSITAQDDD